SIAVAGDKFNRQLHQDEVARIKELAGDDPKRQAELLAASCALIKCSAQYEVGTDEYIYWAGIEALGSKPEYQQDREWLANQTNGELIYTAGNGLPVTKNLFNYGWTDATTDWGSRNLVGPRVAGGLQTAGGIAQIIGGVEACVSLVGCIAAPFLVFSGYDTGKAGLDQLFTGKRQNTWGGTALQGLGFEAETAELLYGMTQLAPSAGLAISANRAINAEVAANNATRATYAASDSRSSTTYFRVEGGGAGNATSQQRITPNADGSITINPGCLGQLCVSVGNSEHAVYYLTNRRPDGSVVVFEVDDVLHNQIMESAVPQRPVPGIPRDPLAPKKVDRNQPGTALELPRMWESLLEEHSSGARVYSQSEFLKEFGNDSK
ncbi:cell surface protein, partial [Xanthomonas hortorum pv. pelargonii]|nr:cell surface protein [Xanthomonas hortorum pv. pelargonii]MCU1711198.1 cell surface protein [Xanthomonas hortorum pv. pelargonii]MCU1715420.1 cell surface protein [Xanthomonas hortorum pv. pelargonii]